MTHRYFAYGLQLESNVLLPGLLTAAEGKIDISIQLREKPEWVAGALLLPSDQRHFTPGGPDTTEPSFALDELGQGRYFHLRYGDGTEFLTDAGTTRLWGCWKPPLTIEDLLTYLLGPVMGFLLRLRGKTSLHAGSVEIAGRAIAVVGPAGSGKSTTAAGLALQGHAVLSEDVSPVAELNGEFFVEPGHPRICLWPDAVAELFGSKDALPKLTPNWGKCYLPLDGGRARFAPRRMPLGAIYVLSERSPDDFAPRLVPLGRREAFMELVQNTYMNYALDRSRRAAEFDVLAQLVRQVPARRVVPHTDPQRIPQLCDLLAEDAARLGVRTSSASPSVLA